MATKADQKRVIVVDDEPTICHAIGIVLRSDGYEVTTMDDGWQAFNVICADPGRFDLVITDVFMPGFSGIKMMKGLRDRGIPLPVLPMTGYSDDDYFDKMRTLGCRHVLLKPFDRQSLKRMIEWTLYGMDAELSLIDHVEIAAQYVGMADAESLGDLSELNRLAERIRDLLAKDDVDTKASALADVAVLEACRKTVDESRRLISDALHAEGSRASAIGMLGDTMAALKAVARGASPSDNQQQRWLSKIHAERLTGRQASNGYDHLDEVKHAFALISRKLGSGGRRAKVNCMRELKNTMQSVCNTLKKEEKRHA